MTQREARQIAYAIAATLCQSSDELILDNGWTEDEQQRIVKELADIAKRLAHNGRRAKV